MLRAWGKLQVQAGLQEIPVLRGCSSNLLVATPFQQSSIHHASAVESGRGGSPEACRLAAAAPARKARTCYCKASAMLFVRGAELSAWCGSATIRGCIEITLNR